MSDFEIIDIHTDNIESELKIIGFDEGYRFVAVDKFMYKNLKIFNLNPAQANILKQTALSAGADCATHRDVIKGTIEKSDVILSGNISQLKKISQKLKQQPFGLKNLADNINYFLEQRNKTRTKLVGILNITPDSFSDGGKYIEPIDAQKHLLEMIEDGADIIDIGAESTRPYSQPVSPAEQINRLKPILKFIQRENITIPISIDTRSSEVADFTLNNGAVIINDVSGLDYDTKLADIITKYNATLILQHSKGTPDIMQNEIKYHNLIEDIYFCLKQKTEYAKNIGIKNIIIDPGIGFGKTKENNIEILDRIEDFLSLDYPIMVGISRKSFLGKDFDNDIKDALTLAYSYPLIKKGIDYLRVHNVKLHKNLINSLIG